MKSINKAQQDLLDERIKRKLSSYIEKLDHSPEVLLEDTQKSKRVAAKLKKQGRHQLADEFTLATSKSATGSTFIEKMKGYIPNDLTDELSQEEITTRTKLNIAKVALEAVQGMSDMVSSRFLYEGARKARTVCRISRLAGPEAIGTGFMISPNLLMTNHHVLKNEDLAEGCYVEFDYFHSKDSLRVQSEIFALRPDGFYYSSSHYDYAIVMVESINKRQAKLSDYGWNSLGHGKIDIEPTNRLNIIHHPLGGHQQISIRKNFVVDIENDDKHVDYVTDTDYGSSGSPVFNDEWNVVAIHMGNSTLNQEDREKFLESLPQISRDLAYEMRNDKIKVNSGIKIRAILEDLRAASAKMSKDDQLLIDQILEDSEDNSELKFSGANVPRELIENKINSPIAHNININGGNVTLNLAQAISQPRQVHLDETRKTDSKVDLELYRKSLTTQTSIFKALDYVQKAREQPYLPNLQDLEKLKEDYYGDIIADSNAMNGVELYDALSRKMLETFKLVDKFPDPLDLDNDIRMESSTPSSYHKARAHLYTKIDLQPDGSLRGVYSGAVIAPEQLMLVDLINSLDDFDYDLPKRYKNADYLNCEHIVPKTYFERHEDGFSDLHHLITADGAVNKFRNKNTYADLEQDGDDGRDRLPLYVASGGWKKGSNFEPARGKALVARATLYFIVAHPNFISTEVYNPEQIKTLVEWALLEGPSDYEKHRNQTIYEVQGNRNPFIDFPNWVTKVDFERGIS